MFDVLLHVLLNSIQVRPAFFYVIIHILEQFNLEGAFHKEWYSTLIEGVMETSGSVIFFVFPVVGVQSPRHLPHIVSFSYIEYQNYQYLFNFGKFVFLL